MSIWKSALPTMICTHCSLTNTSIRCKIETWVSLSRRETWCDTLHSCGCSREVGCHDAGSMMKNVLMEIGMMVVLSLIHYSGLKKGKKGRMWGVFGRVSYDECMLVFSYHYMDFQHSPSPHTLSHHLSATVKPWLSTLISINQLEYLPMIKATYEAPVKSKPMLRR